MGIVYHGSKEHGLTRLEPKKSTHGVYVYATREKVLALNFSSRCGDDLTYSIGKFDGSNDGPWCLVEHIPGAFEKMFSNSSSIYYLSDETFEDIHTGFCEVVSSVGCNVLNEEYCENVLDSLIKAEKQGLVKIYRYPNKPLLMKENEILDKWRYYKYELSKKFKKYDFDRIAYLHPELLDKINALSKEFGYSYHYEVKDLITIFKKRIKRQIIKPNDEQYIECAYISIVNTYPEIKDEIQKLYSSYLDEKRKK